MSQVSQEELAGVLAHELGHVKHRDTLTMTITAVMAGAISMLANMAFFMGGSRDRDHPMGMVGSAAGDLAGADRAVLVQAAISRSREFEADPRGAEITGPADVAGFGLGPDRARAEHTPNYPADANPATAHMFIVNPLHGGISGLFATHPPTEERIARLRAMAGADAAPVKLVGVPWGEARPG
jgi:heat shock protein HtpX